MTNPGEEIRRVEVVPDRHDQPMPRETDIPTPDDVPETDESDEREKVPADVR